LTRALIDDCFDDEDVFIEEIGMDRRQASYKVYMFNIVYTHLRHFVYYL